MNMLYVLQENSTAEQYFVSLILINFLLCVVLAHILSAIHHDKFCIVNLEIFEIALCLNFHMTRSNKNFSCCKRH